MRNYYIFVAGLCATCAVLAVLIFMRIGTPGQQRGLEYDKTRESDFSSISFAVMSYASDDGTLPKSIEEIKAKTDYINIVDPETKKNYEYRVVSSSSYELCTTFSAATVTAADESSYSSMLGQNKPHKKGYDCINYSLPSSFRDDADLIRPRT